MEGRLERYAELIVNFGVNVQPGQILDLGSGLGKEQLTRALTVSAYKRGAKFVDVNYWDPWLKRIRVQHASDDVLDFVPRWYGERTLELGEERGATILLSGPLAPHLYDDLDPERLGRDVFPRVKEWTTVINARTVNWCIAPGPSDKWAELVYPDLEPARALEKLWEQVLHACRMDEPDPEGAWRERSNALKSVAERLTERRFDAIHLEGGGTDLTIGLLPTSRWIGGGDETVDGIAHMANLPTEEVFTTPDPERADGLVRATKPLYSQGRIIDGLTVRFEGGRAVQIDAESGAETLRAVVAQDEGGAYLGEIALVDREGRIGPLNTVFYDTLLDENAAGHIALGSAYESAVATQDVQRINRSSIHVDFMVGSEDVDVTGITREGERVPVLRQSVWQI
ncbi:MAG TPA: aminopeptidase [Gaiellaceae bacterium]|nr:aminopeptidase [Gaiellaceae bacterium]